jgi:hypothetical protein
MKIIPIIILALSSSVAFSQDKLISQITSTYNSNQARFHTQYKGLQFNGSGNVQKIEADFLGTGKEFMVTLNSNGSNLVCSTKDKNAASKLDKGEQIKFTGIIHDVLFGNLLLNNCSFDSKPVVLAESKDIDKQRDDRITALSNKIFECKGVLTNDKDSGLTLCDHTIPDDLKKSILRVCKEGSWCLVKGSYTGYGVFFWLKFYEVRNYTGSDRKEYLREIR